MNRTRPLLFLAILPVAGFLACSDQETYTIPSPTDGPAAPAGNQGVVLETMDGGGYTYVLLDTGDKKVWAASPKTPIKVGQKVRIPEGMVMKDFKSKSLNRTFDRILFVTEIVDLAAGPAGGSGPTPEMPPSHPPVPGMGGGMGSGMGSGMGGGMGSSMGSRTLAPAKVDFTGLTKPAGGHTVAEIYAAKDSLAGKEVLIRGRVIKFSPQIMKINWVHIQDGTGKAGTADLTVTTKATVKEGDTVLVKGKLSLNRDFGYGYKYNVLIENAEVTAETPAEGKPEPKTSTR